MTQSISALTAEQVAALPAYAEKWIKIGLSTEAVDTEQAEHFINMAYTQAGLTIPQVVWVDSPLACQRKARELTGKTEVFPAFMGQLESSWISWYAYFLEEHQLECCKPMAGLIGMIKSLGYCIMFDTVIVCSKRMATLARNDKHQLHCTTGPAVSYADGWAVYALNDVRMEQWMVTTPPEHLNARDVLQVKNVEQRRELIRKIGIERMLAALEPITLDTQLPEYELLSVNLSEDAPKAIYLKMRNPSINVWHVEGVGPECQTVQQAINWRAGNIKKAWKPAILT